MIFALAGNQNSGKTTLFNQLTGANQHVGNFPGVTVDQKLGDIRGQKGCQVVDLPGIYSIRPFSSEEIVTRDFLLDQKPDGITLGEMQLAARDVLGARGLAAAGLHPGEARAQVVHQCAHRRRVGLEIRGAGVESGLDSAHGWLVLGAVVMRS